MKIKIKKNQILNSGNSGNFGKTLSADGFSKRAISTQKIDLQGINGPSKYGTIIAD